MSSRSTLLTLSEELALTGGELALLFGVSDDVVRRWIDHGIPSDRLTHLDDMARTVILLRGKLKPGQLPEVARRSADRLGGRTLIEAMAEDAVATRRLFEEAFDWSIPLVEPEDPRKA